ncbi:2-keto-3-deoxygluconate permease [Alkalihalobacillus sp. 1P02AB]|uniref:2-keto-3-deoxygluconate permease n=1 Tax=Alkalihalobacillus sp. 1P02AB TaxID=3132260 RepID=UPI0039A5FC3E
MPIKSTLDRIPGGIMIIPLILGACINSFAPNLLRIGGFTEALFVNGTVPLIAFFFVCIGAEINLKTAKGAMLKGTTMLVTKWVIGAAVGILAYMLAGPNGLFLGLAPLAIIAAMTNSNGTMYIAIANQFGKKDDRAAIGVLSLNDGPFLTMLALAAFGAMGFGGNLFSLLDFIAVLFPLILGMILGNLDTNMREFLTKGVDALIPFMAFGLGMGISFSSILEGGLAGVVLGVLVVFLTGTACAFIFYKLGWNPVVGLGEGAVAGNAIATPAAIATVSATFASEVGIATVQIAAACVTSGLLLPFYVAFLAKKLEIKEKTQQQITIQEKELA